MQVHLRLAEIHNLLDVTVLQKIDSFTLNAVQYPSARPKMENNVGVTQITSI